ncbi:MAG: hypothetical protein ACR2OB_09665 [Solirubrobacteraceae bacterium]
MNALPAPNASGPRHATGRGACFAAFALLAICGCGGTLLATTQLRAQAAGICAATQARTDRIRAPGTPAGAAVFIKQGTGFLSGELARLRTLQAASDLSGAYRTALSAFSRKLDALRDGARALGRGGDPLIAVKTLEQRLVPIEAQEDHAWRMLGIPACVNR